MLQPGRLRPSPDPIGRPRLAAIVTAAAACLLALVGCQTIPVDTEGTLDRVRGGLLRVGLTHNPPWVDTSGPDAAGTEVHLVERIAAELQAEAAWTVGSEAVLVEELHHGRLDLVAGGFTDDTPWTQRAAMTTPYLEDRDQTGRTRKHVLLTRPGENRFLMTVEQILAGQGAPR